MKVSMMIVMTLALTAVVGCSLSNRGGGVSTDEGFRIAVPTLDTQVKQGELQTVTVSVHRGEYFKRDVKLQIKASKGISVEPTGAFYVLGNIKAISHDSYRLAFDILERAGVGVSPGVDFGANCEGYLRFSYANSLENIGEGICRIEKYLKERV